MELKIERIYTKPVDLNGYRILVDRIWPRGISKENAHLDKWLKEVGPSTELRKWFGHDVARYPEFSCQAKTLFSFTGQKMKNIIKQLFLLPNFEKIYN